MSIKVHQLAKELGITSKELIEKLHKLKINVKSHMNSIDDDTAFLVREELKPKKEKAKETRKPKIKARTEAVKKEAPTKKSVPQEKPQPPQEAIKTKEFIIEKEEKKAPTLRIIQLDFPIAIKDLAVKLSVKPGDLLKKLLDKKMLVTINQAIDEAAAAAVCAEFGFQVEKLPSFEERLTSNFEKPDKPKDLKPRAPIVTFMGHVDHGKTSLLDMIRKTKVADKEAGGITQHIGAYEVVLPKGRVTFLDTPGHAAFTAMRARGAHVTDIVILVVAADDGVMPQTIEAVDHARAAGCPIIVAINKIDKPNINLDKVKKQLAELNLAPEEWGGKTITVGVSAKTGQGIDELLEMLLLEAEILELKANPLRSGGGVVVEAELSKGKGPVARVLISNGTLKIGDIVLVGMNYGRIKAMLDDKGRRVTEAGPAKPLEILGLSGVPEAGEKFYVIDDEKKAREIVASRCMEAKTKKLAGKTSKVTLEELYSKIKEGAVKELRLVLKTDVQGSLEALKDSLEKLSTSEVKLSVIHGQAGDINESDVMLASASDAVVIGFHVDIINEAKALAKQEGVDIKIYNIIYEAVNDVQAAMEGMLEPVLEEIFLGRAEVRQVFNVSKIGIVAGCFIVKGRIPRDATCKIIRDKEVIFKGKINSLKHFKDDIKEAKEGFECGISFGFKDIKSGDLIEAIEIKKVARRLK